MKYILSFITLILISFSITAQSDETLLQAEGEIPKEFFTSSSVKYEKQVQEIENSSNKKVSRKERKGRNTFLLESNFAIDDILRSGLVLFNDPATKYVNQVLAQLPISGDKKLSKKKPRAYILNSSAVNAFATDQGIIFVTLGLLANLQNEAQLAFILAHELIHVKHQHAIDKFSQSKNFNKNNNDKLDEIGVDRKSFDQSLYSQSLEEEADHEGLDIFLKSNYDPKAITNTFTILHYSYLPFEDFPFDRGIFEDEYYKFPEHLWVDQVPLISPMEEDSEMDELSSHPSSLDRLKKLKSRIKKASTKDKSSFILPESTFKNIQSKARYQIPFLNLYDENYADAIYTAALMLEKYPEDLELKKVIGKALYMEAKLQNQEDRDESDYRKNALLDLTEKIEGESHQIYHLITKMNQAELTILATKYNWELFQANKNDKELGILIKDIFVELAYNFDSLEEFATAMPVIPEEKTNGDNEINPLDSVQGLDSTTVKEIEPKRLSKLDKIKQSNNSENEENQDDMSWTFAFIDELKSDDFQTAYKEGLKEYDDRQARKEYYKSEEGEKEWQKELKIQNKKGKAFGIDKIVVVNPFYLSLDLRGNEEVEYVRAEKKQKQFRESIKKISKISKLNATVLDVADLKSKDIEKFNDIVKINQYFSQQMNQLDLSLTPGFQQNAVNEIAEKYGTEYFLWTGVIALHEKHNGWGSFWGNVLFPYIIPFSVANRFTPQYDTLYYAILFDVKTGRRSIIKMDYFNKRDTKTVLNAHIYDTFFQIEQERK